MDKLGAEDGHPQTTWNLNIFLPLIGKKKGGGVIITNSPYDDRGACENFLENLDNRTVSFI